VVHLEANVSNLPQIEFCVKLINAHIEALKIDLCLVENLMMGSDCELINSCAPHVVIARQKHVD